MHVVTDPSIDSHGESVIHLSGEVDVATVPALRQHFDNALRSGFGPITLDCAELTFIDASGIGAFVHLSNGAHAKQRRMAVRNTSAWVSGIFELVGLASMMITDDPADLELAGRVSL